MRYRESQEFLSAYAATKFGVEGWQESLAPEVAPFGIKTMLVEPGFFRTELLTPESTRYAESSIADYAERTEQTVAAWKSMNGRQGGDPAKLAEALVHLAALDEPPLRFPAGADAVATFENWAKLLLEQAEPTATCPATSRRTTPDSPANNGRSTSREKRASGLKISRTAIGTMRFGRSSSGREGWPIPNARRNSRTRQDRVTVRPPAGILFGSHGLLRPRKSVA